MKIRIVQILKHTAFILFSLLALVASAAHAETCVVDDGFWQQPRSGMAVLNNTAIKPCVMALLADNKGKLFIIYNDTDESGISANELRQWLVALALPAERIILKKATSLSDPIRMEIQHE